MFGELKLNFEHLICESNIHVLLQTMLIDFFNYGVLQVRHRGLQRCQDIISKIFSTGYKKKHWKYFSMNKGKKILNAPNKIWANNSMNSEMTLRSRYLYSKLNLTKIQQIHCYWILLSKTFLMVNMLIFNEVDESNLNLMKQTIFSWNSFMED